ncbi:Uncharacterised protein [Neisseria meningitidis]|nr:Uncharacterised protein [Neisseria meningitidis]
MSTFFQQTAQAMIANGYRSRTAITACRKAKRTASSVKIFCRLLVTTVKK